MKLFHGENYIAQVQEAKNLFSRTRGLMFRDSWDDETSLWIHRCNSIHTAFVRFPIDVAFVDKNLVIQKIVKGIPPWRLILPVLKAQSVFEFTTQGKKLDGLKEGDQLNVGH